jgi:hypothetical protein
MATKTTKQATETTVAATEEPGILERFHDRVVSVVGVVTRTELAAVLGKVLFGELLGAMYSALDDETPPVKSDAPKSEQNARRDRIRQKVLDYVTETTGRYYSWSNVSAYVDAGAVNATLPEAIKVRLVEATGENGEDASYPVGHFGVWPLQYLADITDEEVRASFAEELVAAGITTQEGVRQAVNEKLGKTEEPKEPLAADAMAKALVEKTKKREAGPLGTAQHIAKGIPEDDALALADFGRLLWSMTPSDTAVEDAERRRNKRLTVFRDALEQLLYTGPVAEDDGIDDAEAKQ